MNLGDRIVGALALRPMTIQQLATCLCASDEGARAALNTQIDQGFVRRHGFVRHRVIWQKKDYGPIPRRYFPQLFALTQAGRHHRATEISK